MDRSLVYRVRPSCRNEFRIDRRAVADMRLPSDGDKDVVFTSRRICYAMLSSLTPLLSVDWYEAAVSLYLSNLSKRIANAKIPDLPRPRKNAKKATKDKHAAKSRLIRLLREGRIEYGEADTRRVQSWLDDELIDADYTSPTKCTNVKTGKVTEIYMIDPDVIKENFELLVGGTSFAWPATRHKKGASAKYAWRVTPTLGTRYYEYTPFSIPNHNPREGVVTWEEVVVYAVWAATKDDSESTPLHVSIWKLFGDHPLFGRCAFLDDWFLRNDFRLLAQSEKHGFAIDGLGRITLFDPASIFANRYHRIVLEVVQTEDCTTSTMDAYKRLGFVKFCERHSYDSENPDEPPNVYEMMHLELTSDSLRENVLSRLLANGGTPGEIMAVVDAPPNPNIEE
jgi:hypothetical protein